MYRSDFLRKPRFRSTEILTFWLNAIKISVFESGRRTAELWVALAAGDLKVVEPDPVGDPAQSAVAV